jgi:hypothetical protein
MVGQNDRRPVDDTRPFPTLPAGVDVRDGHALAVSDLTARSPISVGLLLYESEGGRAIAPDRIDPRPLGGVPEIVNLGNIAWTRTSPAR